MNCVYCNQPVPEKWYEFHCIPVTRVAGEWIDMYNHLGELEMPIRQVAHWGCHAKSQPHTRPVPLGRAATGSQGGLPSTLG